MKNDNQDIVDALRYSRNISLNGLRQVLKRFNNAMDNTSNIFRKFSLLLGQTNIPYHKTKEFRRVMYYRRYKRNSDRSKKK